MHKSGSLRDPYSLRSTYWVRCDCLPRYLEVRFDGCTEDYTGLGKPGVWHWEPHSDEWRLPIERVFTVDYPNASRAKRVRASSRKKNCVDLVRTQVPCAPEHIVTFQNIQWQTVRTPEGEAK